MMQAMLLLSGLSFSCKGGGGDVNVNKRIRGLKSWVSQQSSYCIVTKVYSALPRGDMTSLCVCFPVLIHITHTDTLPHTCTHTHTYIHTPAYLRKGTPQNGTTSHMHTTTHRHAQTYTHTHTPPPHTCTDTHTHTHMHTHTQPTLEKYPTRWHPCRSTSVST